MDVAHTSGNVWVHSSLCTPGRADVDTRCRAHRVESCVYLNPLVIVSVQQQIIQSVPESWVCAACTLINSRLMAFCEACGTEPPPVRTPRDYSVTSHAHPANAGTRTNYMSELLLRCGRSDSLLCLCLVSCRGSFEHLLLNASADRPLSTSSSQSSSSRPSSRGHHSHSSSGQARRPSSSGSGAERAQSGDDQGHRSEPSGRNSRASSSSSRGSTGSKGSG